MREVHHQCCYEDQLSLQHHGITYSNSAAINIISSSLFSVLEIELNYHQSAGDKMNEGYKEGSISWAYIHALEWLILWRDDSRHFGGRLRSYTREIDCEALYLRMVAEWLMKPPLQQSCQSLHMRPRNALWRRDRNNSVIEIMTMLQKYFGIVYAMLV